jgi:hypothetical protein
LKNIKVSETGTSAIPTVKCIYLSWLYNTVLDISAYIKSNCRIIFERLIGKDVEGSGHDVI